MRNAIAESIIQKAKTDKDFFLITGDAGLGVWDSYQKEFPHQYVNPGINEALCVGIAAGMAMCGKKVVYYNIAPFVMMRPYEQVRNDICYQGLPVILIGTGSGLTYMPSGMTHYAVEDILLASSLPHLNIFSPCDAIEAKACFEYAYISSNPSYIRIPKAGEPIFHKESLSDITQAQILRKAHSDILLVTHSSIVSEVLKVADELDASVVSIPFINSMNPQILELLSGYGRIVVVEEHYSYGGLGTLLREKLYKERFNKEVQIVGLENEYIHLIGNQEYGRTHFGLSCEGIRDKILYSPPPPYKGTK